MTQLFEVRWNEKRQYYEVCSGIHNGGEIWQPAATYWITKRIPYHTYTDLTLDEMLIAEGWTPPKVS